MSRGVCLLELGAERRKFTSKKEETLGFRAEKGPLFYPFELGLELAARFDPLSAHWPLTLLALL